MLKIPKPSDMEFSELRKGIARCVEAVVDSDAVVYDNWALKYDLAETVEILSKTYGKIHAWLVSINSIVPSYEKAGGFVITYDVQVRIWGFVGYQYSQDNDSRQNLIEKECKDIIKSLFLNQDLLGMDTEPFRLKADGLLRFEDIDVHGWGSGDDLFIAQGTMNATWEEPVEPI